MGAIEYDVISEYKMDRLIKNVNKRISLGWTPQGGVCCHWLDSVGKIFYQAMIRRPK